MMKELWLGLHRRSRASSALLLSLAAIPATPVPSSGSSPDWLRAAAHTPLPKYPDDTKAVVLWSEETHRVSQSGEVRTAFRKAYKILRPEGRSLSRLRVDFDSETEITYLKGWTLTANGGEREVKEKDAVESALVSDTLYQDARFKVLTLPAADPGSILGFEYEQKRRPSVREEFWGFQEEIPVRRAQFILELASGWAYEIYWMNYPVIPPRVAAERRWVWEVEDVPAVNGEPSMPAWGAVAGLMGVAYGPRPTESERVPITSWRDLGRWYAELAKASRRPTTSIQQETARLAAPVSTVPDKIRALAAFVQRDVRYVAIEIGIGGYQPHLASDVLKNRYGDCKDKVTLLNAMLRETGVESHYVLVNSQRGIVRPDFPFRHSFNHVIAAIRVPEDSAFLATLRHPTLGLLLLFDPTDSDTPIGYLPSGLQAGLGLLVTENGGELLELPLLAPQLNRLIRVGRFQISPSGALSGEMTELSWGLQGHRRRAQLLQTTSIDRMKIVEEMLAASLSSFHLTGAQVVNLEDPREALELRYQFTADPYAQAAGDLLIFPARVLGRKPAGGLEEKPRKFPWVFDLRVLETDSLEITLPTGYQVDELPQPVRLESPFAVYRCSIEAAGNVLKYARWFESRQVWVPAEETSALRKFFQQMAAADRAAMVLKRTGPK